VTRQVPFKPARERILDAAARVMREKGLAKTTTKLIAAAADYSEATLYKHFADKQELFLAVLDERTPPVRIDPAAAGHGDLAANLAQLAEQLMNFFAHTFPIAASIFSSPELLVDHRQGVTSRGRGPRAPLVSVRSYLDAERDSGRLPADADTDTAAKLLIGAAFHQGFLAAFDGLDHVPDAAAKAAEFAAAIAKTLQADSDLP
jgi:AcrR family transcriptional regulator